MSSLLENDEYEIYFSHQCDERPFNRGAIKNIGFLAMKNKYPEHYQDITFVFHDIDTIPFDKIFEYETEVGVAKHFYGFEYALGGIVSLKGYDFERINGYPNYWGWGMEDAILQKRCEENNIFIDRNDFYPVGSPEILHLFDGITRFINKKETRQSNNNNHVDGLKTIHNLKYMIDSESLNPLDNIHVFHNDKIFFINVTKFLCLTRSDAEVFHEYDLREPTNKIMQTNRVKPNNSFMENNWSNIPFYPTADKKQEMIYNFGKEQTEQIIQQNLQYSQNPTESIINVSRPNIPNNRNTSGIPVYSYPSVNTIPRNVNNVNNMNKYSPNYAQYIGAKPPATTSANIGLGGIRKF